MAPLDDIVVPDRENEPTVREVRESDEVERDEHDTAPRLQAPDEPPT